MQRKSVTAAAWLLLTGIALAGEIGMTGLPMADGRTFDDLDSYLAYRAELGAMDRPYYQQVGPDLFQLIRGRASGSRPPELFTRQQLLEEFGFDH